MKLRLNALAVGMAIATLATSGSAQVLAIPTGGGVAAAPSGITTTTQTIGGLAVGTATGSVLAAVVAATVLASTTDSTPGTN